MKGMGQSLEIVVTLEHNPKDKILTHLYSESPWIIAFPVLEGLEDIIQELWQKPASLQPTCRRVEYFFYNIKKEPFNYFTTHPPPSSLMEMWLRGRKTYLLAPTDREGGSGSYSYMGHRC